MKWRLAKLVPSCSWVSLSGSKECKQFDREAQYVQNLVFKIRCELLDTVNIVRADVDMSGNWSVSVRILDMKLITYLSHYSHGVSSPGSSDQHGIEWLTPHRGLMSY